MLLSWLKNEIKWNYLRIQKLDKYLVFLFFCYKKSTSQDRNFNLERSLHDLLPPFS